MAKRRQTIDTNLFARTDDPNRKDSPPGSLHASKQVPEPPELPGGRRVGVSFYFGTETIEALEKGLQHLKELARDRDHRGRVSKSDLVELAVLWALADLEARGAKSAFATLVTE